MPEHDSAALPAHETLPRHTTPTWEMELLISGATVFALMQLPAVLDAAFHALMPRFDRTVAAMILLPYVYLKSANYVLVATFIGHLATRGYWVALVGLRSVYPDGVRWDHLRWGPNYVAAIRERTPSMAELVERADNRASKVFGYGIGFALLVLAPLLLVTAVAALAYALYLLLGGRYEWIDLWALAFAVLFVPFGLALLADRFYGRRLGPLDRTTRGLRSVFHLYLRAGFSSLTNFPILMFMSRYGQRRGGALVTLSMLLLVTLTLAQLFWQDESSLGSYGRLGTVESGDERTLVPEHYADQRGAAATMSPLPFIASETIRGDYLRVFIPFRPSRDNPALAERCPPMPGVDESRAIAVVLDCLALLYPLALDGITIADPNFDRAQDPVTGLRGVVAMIRVAELAPGRHLLEISRPARAARDSREAPEPPHRIPFWR